MTPLLLVLIAAALVLATLVVALYAIRILPFIIMGGLVIGQLLRLGLSSESSSALLAIDIFNSGYVILGLAYALATKKRYPIPLSLYFLGAFLVWACISLVLGSPVLTGRELLSASLYLIRFMLMCGTLLVTFLLFPTAKHQRPIITAFIIAGLMLTLLGYVQLVLFPNFAFMATLGWDPHIGRVLSTFFDPNFFGMFLVVLFSVLLSRVLYEANLKQRTLLLGLLAIVLGAIFLTFSRSSYLALMVSVFLIIAMRNWRLVLLVGLIVLAMGSMNERVRTRVVGAFKVDATAKQRIESWKGTLRIINDNPVTGVGYNAFGPTQERYGLTPNQKIRSSQGSDSSLLLVAATTGYIGLAIYLLFGLTLLYELLLAYRVAKDPHVQSIALASLGILPAYVIHSQFVNGLFYPLLLIPIFFITAYALLGLHSRHES